jgi:acyl dehydratase
MFDSPSMPAPRCDSLQDLQRLIDQDIYISDPVWVDQARIDGFAQATGDFQWIHVDPERASRESPFGGTIAHGFLSLSLLGKFYEDFLPQLMPFAGFGLNYGLNKVRFMSPVRSPSQVRGRFRLHQIERVPGAVQLIFIATLEVAGQAKPACVAESVVRRQVHHDQVI